MCSSAGSGVPSWGSGMSDTSSLEMIQGDAENNGKGPDSPNNGNKRKRTPPRIPVPPTDQEGTQISPAETTGELPPTRELDPMSQQTYEGIQSWFEESLAMPMGFTNTDAPIYPTNVCYRNAVISMLLNVPTFSNWLRNYQTRQETRSMDVENDPTAEFPAPVVQSLARLNDIYWRSGIDPPNKQEQLNEAMDAFFQEFVGANIDFTRCHEENYWDQEDAEDFLDNLLASIEEELEINDIVNRMALAKMIEFGLLPRKYCVNGCETKKRRAGEISRGKMHRFHITNGLPSRQTHKTYVDALNASLKDARDAQNPPTACAKCGKQTQKRTWQKFAELPKLLLTMMQRNTQDGRNIKVETDCPLSRYFVPPVDQKLFTTEASKRPVYRIAGVVSHAGRTGAKGHNISLVPNHNEEGKWYRINDMEVDGITFQDVNKFAPKARKARQLPYIVAWELIEMSTEQIEQISQAEAVPLGGSDPVKEQSQKAEELKEWEELLSRRELMLENYKAEFGGRLRELQKRQEKSNADRDHNERGALFVQMQIELLEQKASTVRAAETALEGKEAAYTRRWIALKEEEAALTGKENALEAKEIAFEKREKLRQQKAARVHAEVVALEEEKLRRKAAEESEQRSFATLQDRSEEAAPGEGAGFATFCATFSNVENPVEEGRATFRLRNFKADAPTKIQSTIRLTDREGNVRAAKKGTTVSDDFIITFNVKVGKRRRGGEGGDDGHGAAAPPPAKKRRPVRGASKQAPAVGKEEAPKSPERMPEGPRRSARANKGQPPRKL